MNDTTPRNPLHRARFAACTLALTLCAQAIPVGAAVDAHLGLTWNGPGTCLTCHTDRALQVHGSVMYQWQGDAPSMLTGPAVQGKIPGGVNSYCINILGNWGACSACHVGLGAVPEAEPTTAQLENIDCMLCHQQEYRRTKVDGVFVPDLAAMTITMDEAVETVHLPVRYNCLQCHAKAGGGDAVKRGDLALAHVATADILFDVHMATTGEDLVCQQCHTVVDHRFAGKGSDLRPTDSAAVLECANCHADMAVPGGHSDPAVERHLDRVACQSCHIPFYAKDASDTLATEATEVHRTWLGTHSTAPPYHPAAIKENRLVPAYRFWNRSSRNILLHDRSWMDPVTGRYPTSRPAGHVSNGDAKLFAFKYKTAEQPIIDGTRQLVAIATDVFFATADPVAATEQGLVNMGLDPTTPYSWIETDTYQMLNHQVAQDGDALLCSDCHGIAARVDLVATLDYSLWGETSVVCVQCHEFETPDSFEQLHDEHVRAEGFDCSWCHDFSRPERGLTPSSAVFRDDVESGDTFAWSTVVGWW